MVVRTWYESEGRRNSSPPVGTAAPAESYPRPPRLAGTLPPTAMPTGTIVVIDDSATALTVISQWLEESGHRVVPLPRALGATTTLLHVRPDVLLLDIQMPGLSGDRFARVLAQNPTTASIPIIFYSQLDPAHLKQLAKECAVVGAIAKTSSRGIFLHEFSKLAGPFLPHPGAESATNGPTTPDPQDIGVAELDVQRHHLKRLANRISEIVRDIRAHEDRITSRQELRATLLELIVFMRYHLTTEDRYLRTYGCASIVDRRQRHEAYLDEAMTLERRIEMDLSLSDLLDCARRIRLLTLEHLWTTDAKAFQTH